jgi:hypothetical protein
VGLPRQLAQVDPIVASFVGGAVGVLTTLLVVEANNAKLQAKRRCCYCEVGDPALQGSHLTPLLLFGTAEDGLVKPQTAHL